MSMAVRPPPRETRMAVIIAGRSAASILSGPLESGPRSKEVSAPYWIRGQSYKGVDRPREQLRRKITQIPPASASKCCMHPSLFIIQQGLIKKIHISIQIHFLAKTIGLPTS